MATKNISITEEAYKILSKQGKNNESFSEIITRVLKKPNWDEYMGILSKESADELEKNIRLRRERHKISRAARIKRIVEELNNGLS